MDHREDNTHQQGDYNRPRRPNPETISYLRSLPLDLQVAREEIAQFLHEETSSGSDPLFPQTLAAALAAIDEVRNEIASLAGDEYGSQCLELLAAIVCPYSEQAARWMVHALSGYHLHLATHRFGSHVVQTILELSASQSCKVDLGLHEEAPTSGADGESLPSLTDLVLGMVDELAPHAAQLSVHVCGSHVLRTLLCVLGGVIVVPNAQNTENSAVRRGKIKSKKKKKKKSLDAQEQRHRVGMHMEYRTDTSRLQLHDNAFQSALDQLTEALAGGEDMNPAAPDELQRLACHASAGPLLITLLRVLTYRFSTQHHTTKSGSMHADRHLGLLREEPHFAMNSPAHKLAKQILCWQASPDASMDTVSKQQSLAANVLYGMSGEPRGSHMVESLLQLSPDEWYADVLELGDYANPSTMQDYVQHDVSNFIVQTVLSTIRSSEQADSLLKSVEKSISSGYVSNPENKRRGILWRAMELSSKYRVRQESLLKAMRVGMGVAYCNSNGEGAAEREEHLPEEQPKKKKKRQKLDALSIPECIPRLLNVRPPESDDGRVGLDTSGTRAIYHLLRFAPRLCEDVVKGITENLSVEDVEWIAKDGLGSRCIIDGILDGPRNQPVFEKARRDLLAKLAGRWTALATHRVGHHGVLKLFDSLHDRTDKAILVSELAQNIQRLGGNAMGRSVMDQCAVNQFLEGQTAWNEALRRQQKREEFLNDLESPQGEDKETTLTGTDEKKRKRKRKSGSHGEDTGTTGKGPASAVESILQTLSSATSSSNTMP